jgi:hypothetical protein
MLQLTKEISEDLQLHISHEEGLPLLLILIILTEEGLLLTNVDILLHPTTTLDIIIRLLDLPCMGLLGDMIMID